MTYYISFFLSIVYFWEFIFLFLFLFYIKKKGNSLENAWRRAKDIHRRQYLSWLETLGLLLPDVDQDMEQDIEEEEEESKKVERGEKGEREILSGGATAMFTEFPEWGHHQSSLRLMQQLPDMQRHLQRTAAAVTAGVTAEPGVQSGSISLSEQRVIELEEEVANLKKRLEMA